MRKIPFFELLLVLIITSLVFSGNIFAELSTNSVIDKTLVMFHDTTVVSGKAKRLADRDSVIKYLPSLLTVYDVMYFNNSTVLPSLTEYNRIILVETSYDNNGNLCLGSDSRTAIKNWLSTGTFGNRKFLISIGGDQGYNYDRIGSANLDTAFTRSYCGFNYVVDMGVISPGAITGVIGADVGITRTIISPADGGFYPDGCRPTHNGMPFYKYVGHSVNDTLGGIAKVTNSFVTITSFQDPRYFYGGVKSWLLALISYTRIWGPDGIYPVNETAEKYSLSQNYPNPFNPSTKITFSIPRNGFVILKVYDLSGKEVVTLVNKNMTVGSYAADFNGTLLSNGVYFYRLESNSFVETKKMMLVK